MSVVFERVAVEVAHYSDGKTNDKNIELLRPLDHRARRVLGLFGNQEIIRSSDVATILGISARQARLLLSQWVTQGWLEVADPSKRGRKYKLAGDYKDL